MSLSLGSPASDGRPRSLADDLRARDDAALAALLRARPDLRTPVPADLAALAARATTRPSVGRALDHLDAFTLQAVDALVVLPDRCTRDDVRRLLGADPAAALATLREEALLYGGDELTLVRTVREIIGEPAGLGPGAETAMRGYGPSRLARLLADLGLSASGDPVEDAHRVGDHLGDRDRLDALLADADPQVVELLAALTWGPPSGRIERADRILDVSSAKTPIEWLLARGVLVALDASTVVLPREVGLALRDGHVHRAPSPTPPDPVLARADVTRTDHAATGAAGDVVRRIEELLETWATDPPKALRAGGLGVRDRARSAAALDVDQSQLSLLLETAHAAGLLAVGGGTDEVWLPTLLYDTWRTWSVADRWSTLVESWLGNPRVAGLAGNKDGRGKVLAPLGPDLARSLAPGVRREVLDAMVAIPVGQSTTVESVAAGLRWRTPRLFGRLREDLVVWTMREAEIFGVSTGGAPSSFGRLFVAGSVDRAVDTLEVLLPEPLEHVLLQADLTAVAPGPLTGELAQRMALIADVESRGGATTYRFTDATIRRALDLGETAGELLELLSTHSRTPVPQPLTYLVEDVARRHGRVRVGAASAYIRCDDETTLTEILADRKAAGLRLRRLAPTVLAAQAPIDVVLATLRETGHAPAAEGTQGEIVLRRPDERRAATPHRLPAAPVATAVLPPTVLAVAVQAIRAGDRARTAIKRPPDIAPASAGFGGPPSAPTVDVLALLTEAVATGDTVWIGYVDIHGQATQRLIEPESVEGGYVEAFDRLRQERRRFAVHRITGAATIDEPA